MITEYTKQKPKKQATTKQIQTTIYNALNAEHIGLKTMEYQQLIQHVGEHFDELRISYTLPTIMRCIDEMVAEDILYRVTTNETYKIGITKK